MLRNSINSPKAELSPSRRQELEEMNHELAVVFQEVSDFPAKKSRYEHMAGDPQAD